MVRMPDALHAMIQPDVPTRPVPASILLAPGGFAWWYLELLDKSGNGVVLIWSFGLPFLPGYVSAARAECAERPADRPSLTVSIYEAGKPTAYVLHEFSSHEVECDGHTRWRFGHTTIRHERDGANVSVFVLLDCPLASNGSAIQGQIRATGVMPNAMGGARADVPFGDSHRWTPLLAPGFGTARITIGANWRRHFAGRAYHDRNASRAPFHSLGIRQWIWGHATLPDRERVAYMLQPEAGDAQCLGVDLLRSGKTERVDGLTPLLPHSSRTLFGMPTWKSIGFERDGEPWMTLRLADRVDNGPFYLRYLAEATADGNAEAHHGSCEVIVPERVDLARHRPLVKMAVSSSVRRNSIWLPLFQGVRIGRFRRMIRGWLGRLTARKPSAVTGTAPPDSDEEAA